MSLEAYLHDHLCVSEDYSSDSDDTQRCRQPFGLRPTHAISTVGRPVPRQIDCSHVPRAHADHESMNGHPPSFASVAAATAVGSPPTSSHQPFRHASRSSLDSTPNGPTMQQGERNGSIPMPVGHRPFGSIGGGDMAGMGPTGMPRSPPKNKSMYISLYR